jgi:peptidoglycan DL-endopeptidase CwlO
VSRSRTLPLLGLLALLSTLVVVPAAAEPSSDEVRGDIEAAQQRLQEIEAHASGVVEEYNTATVALEEVNGALEATEARLAELSGEVDELAEAAGDHVRRLHKLGPTLELSSVFVAGDGAELGARSAALRRILDGQRADFEGLDAARTELDASERRLVEQQALAQEREAEVAAQQQEVEETLASYEDEITALRAQLEEVEEREAEEERRRQREAEAEARREREAEEAAAREAAEQDADEREAARQQEAEAAEDAGSDGSSGSSGSSSSSSPSGSSSSGSSGGSGGSGSAPSSRQSASTAVDTALDQVGKPYQWGGSGPDSYDCSGLTSYAWRSAGVEITRTSRSQWDYTRRISRSELQPGDLVFYSRDGTRDGIGHVAMYIGGGDIVEAPYSGNNVRVRSDGLSRNDILGYGRV